MTDETPIEGEVFEEVDCPHELAALRHFLGYDTAKGKLRELPGEVVQICERGRAYLTPKATYVIYPVLGRTADRLSIGGCVIHGKVASFLAGSERIAVFVVTAGHTITERSRRAAHSGNVIEAWALDALGSYAAEATAEAMSRHLERRVSMPGAVSPRYSPGYCGMHIDEQSVLFKLIDASKIGVSLGETQLMQPLKSVSGIIGIGRSGTFARASSPCERCQLTNCSMRRR